MEGAEQMTQFHVNRTYSIEQLQGQFLNTGKTSGRQKVSVSDNSFAQILEQTTSEVKFSKHANERLQSRNIDLSESQKERLNHAVKAAEAKGIKESLVMLDDLAFIVNVKNNTVVTAIGSGEQKVFSNIDGAVVG